MEKKLTIRSAIIGSIIALILLPIFQATAYIGNATRVRTPARLFAQTAETLSPDQEVIARVIVKSELEKALLAATNVKFLTDLLDEKIFIRAKYAQLENLQSTGWPLTLLYVRQGDPDGNWQAVANGFECESTINPTYKSFPGAGGVSTFDLVTGPECEWVILTDETWIHVTGVPQGTGSREFTYLVDENQTSSNRVGHIFVAGQIHTVFQGRDFADVPRSHPFYAEIGRLSARGVTQGCSADNFCPNDLTSREQIAALIIRSLGEFNPPTPAMQRFNDVPPTNPFYAFIEEMAVRGITTGCGGGNYCPTQPVLREQIAAFIIRALGEFNPPTPQSQRFQDVPPSNPFYAFIDRLAALQITMGCSVTPPLYCPTDPVTRGQIAVFLTRAFAL